MIIKVLFLSIFSWSAPLKVDATFSILADMVRQIAPDVEARALVGADSDVHAFEPAPGDLKAIAKADLIVMNGMGLDHWMDRLIKATHYRGELVVAMTGVQVLRNDPHCWQDPLCGIQYVENMSKALQKLRPERALDIAQKSEAFKTQIRAVYERHKKEFDAIPVEQRRILTSHDSLAYFGRAYGVEILTLRGPTTASESSASDLARMTKMIKEQKLKVAFFENSGEDRALRQLAKDYGIRIGGTLYTDSLSKKVEGSTYLKMIETNASRVLEQLRVQK